MIERSERIRRGDILRNDWCSDANPNRYTMYIGRDDRFFIGINYKGKRVRHYIDQNKIVGVGNFEGMAHIGVIRKPYGERNDGGKDRRLEIHKKELWQLGTDRQY